MAHSSAEPLIELTDSRGLMARGLMARGLVARGLTPRGVMMRGVMARGLIARGLMLPGRSTLLGIMLIRALCGRAES